MRISLYISFLLFFVGISHVNNYAEAQSQVLNVEQFTIDNGLSQTSVNCIMQDSKGFIWVGTQDGLNKFDGYTFKIFKHDPSNIQSLSSNFINCFIEDAEGNIWIGTNEGLNMYNIYTEEFVNYLYDESDKNTIPEDAVYYLYQDNQGYIWIKTEKYLSRLNPGSGKFRHYEHYNDVFNFITVNAKFTIFEDHKGQLWVGTKDGLNYFDRKLEIFKRYKHDPQVSGSLSNNKVKVIFEDSENNLWVGTEDGLNLFNWETEQFKRFYNESKQNSLSNNVINGIFEDKNHDLWIATDDGLNKYNKKTQRFKKYSDFFIDYQSVRANSYTSIIQDHTGVIWAGTLQGLLKINNIKRNFKVFNEDENNVPYFSNNIVVSIYEKNGIVWIGTWGAGLFLFNPVNKDIKWYNTENSSLVNDYIHKIYERSNGDIWIGTQNGINVFNHHTKKIEVITQLDIFNTFQNNRIYDIYEEVDKSILIATKFGLHKITDGSVQSFYHDEKDSTTISSNEVFDILKDSNGNIWCGTKKGLNKINLSKNTIKRYYRNKQDCRNCISSNEVLNILEDTLNNCLWVGTVEGLNKFDLTTETFKVYTENDGLPNNLIYAILKDNNENLWISTNRGISKFDIRNNEFTNFGVIDGLQDFEFNHGAYHKSKNGELFFGGINGYNSFFPDSIQKNQNIPNIVITSIELLTNKFSGNIPMGKNNQIEIPHKNSLLTIEFAALDYTNPKKNNYAYKLEGAEDEWINFGNRRYATFTNLPSGKYILRVIGSNSDNIWNEEGVSLKIIVRTPFWKSKLAYLTYVVLFFGAIFWFFQYRTRSLRRSNQELKEKELIAKQVAKQKEELTVKNKNITDSIIYAKRIQEALMPSMKLFNQALPDSFILHKAKDIVSGDFYWINQRKDKVFVAVVDCTGHGVPGAFMSIIGFELLRKITDDLGIDTADEILQNLNDGVATTFGKTTENVRLKDGMDIALCESGSSRPFTGRAWRFILG